MARETKTVLDELIAGAGGAIDDIRSKLIDEAWFGRSVAVPDVPRQSDWELPDGSAVEDALSHVPAEFFDPPSARDAPPVPALGSRPSFEEMWATRERGPDGLEPERDHDQELER